MNTYELWKTSVQLAEDAATEAERAHHRAIAGVLRGDAIKDYFGHIADELYDPTEEVVDTPDDNQVNEFFRDLDALRTPPQDELDRRTDGLPTRVLDALKAMEHLNYTGEHTHFEVLTDARQVVAEVMRGRAIPQLERFRCPSQVRNALGGGGLRCELPLPHDGDHQASGVSWTDAQSTNPPKSYDEPEPCGDKHTFRRGMLAGKTYTCIRETGHGGQHESRGHSKWT